MKGNNVCPTVSDCRHSCRVCHSIYWERQPCLPNSIRLLPQLSRVPQYLLGKATMFAHQYQIVATVVTCATVFIGKGNNVCPRVSDCRHSCHVFHSIYWERQQCLPSSIRLSPQLSRVPQYLLGKATMFAQ